MTTAAAPSAASAGVKPFSTVYLPGDSWVCVDEPGNSFSRSLQAALDGRFGQGNWRVVNAAFSGKPFSRVPGVSDCIIDWIYSRVLAAGDADMVQLEGGMNDWAYGRTADQVIEAFEEARNVLDAAGIPHYACTCGPFGGGPFDDATRRAEVQKFNNYIRTRWAGRYVDLWTMFSVPQPDPTASTVFKPALKFDHFHPNGLGKTLWAATAANTINWMPNTRAVGLRASKEVAADQDMTVNDIVRFLGAILGGKTGFLRALTIKPPDPTTDSEQIALVQFNTDRCAILFHADVSGDLVVRRVVDNGDGTSSSLDMFRISGTGLLSSLKGALALASAGTGLRVADQFYGNGAGNSFEVIANPPGGYRIVARSRDGTQPAEMQVEGLSVVFKTGPANQYAPLSLNKDATISMPLLGWYPTPAAAKNAIGPNRVFFNQTIQAVDISR